MVMGLDEIHFLGEERKGHDLDLPHAPPGYEVLGTDVIRRAGCNEQLKTN